MLKIEYVDINSIKPYENNAKLHPQCQIDQIKSSIEQIGFKDPIGIWNGEIVEGHGRYLAAKQMGVKDIPVIRLDDLSDEQRRAYALIHNQLTMNSNFDLEILQSELDEIYDIDMDEFDFDLPEENQSNTKRESLEDERDPSCQHNVFENQELMQFPLDGFYGIPEMKATQTTGDRFLRFMDWREVENPENYIAHFYYDDYKFISAWREPDKYLERLRQFKAVVSPDFSLYTDFPRALQILSCYRRQWCGAFWQHLGIDVIPDVVWGDKESFSFCFDGIPKKSVVAVSSVGVKRDIDWNGNNGEMFKEGYDEMLNRLQPTKILFYGDMIDGLEGDIIQIPSYYAEKRAYLNDLAKKKR